MPTLTAVKALKDNYIWILADANKNAIVIDPGDAPSTIKHFNQHSYKPKAILLTHHHSDHVGGVKILQNAFPSVAVYGPNEVTRNLAGINVNLVNDKTIINEIGLSLQVFLTPGHTLGHVSYYAKPYLFCGDVLFSAGCGRVFEGTMTQMFNSLTYLAKLDNNTLICSGHEYTLGNLEFAHRILPDDLQIKHRLKEVMLLTEHAEMTLPTTLALEKEINVFLRCNDSRLKEKLNITKPDLLFAELRRRKDDYQ